MFDMFGLEDERIRESIKALTATQVMFALVLSDKLKMNDDDFEPYLKEAEQIVEKQWQEQKRQHEEKMVKEYPALWKAFKGKEGME